VKEGIAAPWRSLISKCSTSNISYCRLGSCTAFARPQRIGERRRSSISLPASPFQPPAQSALTTLMYSLCRKARRDRFPRRACRIRIPGPLHLLSGSQRTRERDARHDVCGTPFHRAYSIERATDLPRSIWASPSVSRNKPAAALSRGEQQRVRHLREALANGPPLVLADEPWRQGLDARDGPGEVAGRSFLAVCRQDQKTLLLVSHDRGPRSARRTGVIEMAELNRAEGPAGSPRWRAVVRR